LSGAAGQEGDVVDGSRVHDAHPSEASGAGTTHRHEVSTREKDSHGLHMSV
ncbi:hypothetical protein LTR95_013632, partial [Oleoguttula sp. CCFEE 5521]